MKCPNCQKELKPERIGSTVYWRCHSCGALWFDNKENDFLTEEEAKELAKYKKQPTFGKLKYLCPRDKQALKYEKHYYHCYVCGGVMASAKAILEEKKSARRQWAENFQKPINLSQLKQVVIFALIILFVGLNISLVNALKQRYSLTIQAKEIKNNLQIRQINRSKLALYFTTDEPCQTTAVFENSQKSWEKVINPNYSLNHFLIVNKPELETTVRVKLRSIKNEETFSEKVALAE